MAIPSACAQVSYPSRRHRFAAPLVNRDAEKKYCVKLCPVVQTGDGCLSLQLALSCKQSMSTCVCRVSPVPGVCCSQRSWNRCRGFCCCSLQRPYLACRMSLVSSSGFGQSCVRAALRIRPPAVLHREEEEKACWYSVRFPPVFLWGAQPQCFAHP